MASNIFTTFIFVIFGVSVTFSEPLPTYLSPCNRNDPNFKNCVLQSANKAQKYVINGDKRFNIKLLDPYFLKKLDVQAAPELLFHFEDVTVTGLANTSIIALEFDFDKNEVRCSMAVHDKLNMMGKYKTNGKILILPLEGNGDANITFVGGIYNYTFGWDFVKRDNKIYASIKLQEDLKFELDRAYCHFSNLFPADKRLGPQVNKFLNENWREVIKEIGKGFGDTFNIIIGRVWKKIFDEIPFDELFIK